MRPFILESASQFRAPAPPALSSPEYATALNEVKALGGVTSTARTAAQTAIGQFWNANVINQYNQVFRDVASAHGLDLVDTVRLLAMGTVIPSDAGITCMDSKYHYLLWRPVTAIRNADKDANTATDPSPTWSPLLTTPNHPEYPSAHGCATAAVTDVLAAALKTTNINIDVPGATGGGTTLDHDTPLRHRSRTPRRRRQRPHLGRPALPLLHHRRRRDRPPSQQIRPTTRVPARKVVTLR